MKKLTQLVILSTLVLFIGCQTGHHDHDGSDHHSNEGVHEHNQDKESVNVAAYKKILAAYDNNDPAALDAVVDVDIMIHQKDPDIPGEGLEHWKNQVTRYAESFPDMNTSIEKLVVNGDELMAYLTIRGTNSGPSFGKESGTNKKMEVHATDYVRFENGKAVEHMGLFDVMAMMEQLGMMPEMVMPDGETN